MWKASCLTIISNFHSPLSPNKPHRKYSVANTQNEFQMVIKYDDCDKSQCVVCVQM